MFPALDKHFVNGQVAFPGFNKLPEALTVTLRGRKMKVRDLMKMNHREQIVVTREADGTLLAQERHVYEKDFFESVGALSGKEMVTETILPPTAEEIEKYKSLGHMEQFEMIDKHRREVNEYKKLMRGFWDAVPRAEDVLPNLFERIVANGQKTKEEKEEKVVELDPVALAKLEKKKEANRKKREKKKAAKKNQATNPEDILCEKLEKLNLSEA